MASQILNHGTLFLSLMWMAVTLVSGQSYQDIYRLEQDVFVNYSRTIRPLRNQTDRISIMPSFGLIAVVDVDEPQQQLVINGFLGLLWRDEMLTWNASDYNGVTHFEPEPEMIWKPRMILLNTMDERDMFEDDFAPVSVDHTGLTYWLPGGLFPSLCSLNLQKYPFDAHKCELQITPMFMNAFDMDFNMTFAEVLTTLFIENGEWNLDSTSISSTLLISNLSVFKVLRIEFNISRKPVFFLINILFPVVFLCALNVLTFVIPVDAGEKISFSITVLLSMSVYMAIVGDKLPTNSEKMPYMTNFIFFMFTLAVCSCFVTIAIVWLHHKEEEEEKKQKLDFKIKGTLSKLKVMNTFKGPGGKAKVQPTPSTDDSTRNTQTDVMENGDGEPLQYSNPKNVLPSKPPITRSNSDNLAITRNLFQKLKAGLTPRSSAHDLHAAKNDQHHPRGARVNRYKNMADKLNFYGGIAFGFASLLATLVIIIMIST